MQRRRTSGHHFHRAPTSSPTLIELAATGLATLSAARRPRRLPVRALTARSHASFKINIAVSETNLACGRTRLNGESRSLFCALRPMLPENWSGAAHFRAVRVGRTAKQIRGGISFRACESKQRQQQQQHWRVHSSLMTEVSSRTSAAAVQTLGFSFARCA